MSAAEEHDANEIPLPAPSHESPAPEVDETLTDVIDRLSRKAFRRTLERRHRAPDYRDVVEAARAAQTTSS